MTEDQQVFQCEIEEGYSLITALPDGTGTYLVSAITRSDDNVVRQVITLAMNTAPEKARAIVRAVQDAQPEGETRCQINRYSQIVAMPADEGQYLVFAITRDHGNVAQQVIALATNATPEQAQAIVQAVRDARPRGEQA